ncbi:hypothetical protein DFJ73DRAFT_820656 [Zopfochytrium polystomum]|nr:hypothetical protein DFJ73DRAFT_820656 [Zopfochytrium polystomum]
MIRNNGNKGVPVTRSSASPAQSRSRVDSNRPYPPPISRSSSNGALLIALLATILIAIPVGWWNHAWLPAPVLLDEASAGPRFSEAAALNHTRVLAEEIGFRMTGTVGEMQAEKYIVRKLNEYKKLAEGNPHVKEFDVTTETVSGSHRFLLMNKEVDKLYTNVTNILVRISCGPPCNENALLINSHYDTQIGTPGATDDAVGVSVMLELARLTAISQTPLRNALVLLFNGAEETLQDASHGFVTQSPLFRNIRAFLNVEAMGNDGKGILFQANARGLVDAYAKVPWKHGSVLSNDIFRIGLIGSDTDYKQFVDHGDLVGLDFALYQNSYIYHTILDTFSAIRPGVYQYLGDTIATITHHLITSAPIETFTMSRDFVYYDLFGYFFFVYDWNTATALHAFLIIFSILVVLRPAFVKVYLDPKSAKTQRNLSSVLAFLWTVAAVAFTFVVVFVSPAILGAVMHFVLKKPMTWFKVSWNAMFLFTPATVFALITTHILTRVVIPAHPQETAVSLERRSWAGMMLFDGVLLALSTFFRIGSSYLVFLFLACSTLGLLLDRALSPPGNGSLGSHFPIRPESYILNTAVPFAMLAFQARSFSTLFVPLAGRLGAATPVDVVVGVVAGLIGAFGALRLVPLCARFSTRGLRRAFWISAWILLGAVAIMSASFPFDQSHPKRVYVQYTRDTRPWTNTPRTLDISHSDPASMPLVLSSVGKGLAFSEGSNSAATPPPLQHRQQHPQERSVTWSPLHPFTQFLDSYAFDISHLPVAASELPPPVVEVLESSIDLEKGEKTVALQIFHPHHHWSTLVFNTSLMSWSLATPPYPGLRTHIIREAGGHLSNLWSVNLTFAVTPDRLNLTLSLAAVERDTYQMKYLDVQSDAEKGGNGGDGKWRWPAAASSAFASGEILRRVQSAVPEWVSELYMATVVQEAVV